MTETLTAGLTCDVQANDIAGFFQHGWHSWCATGWTDPAEERHTIRDTRDRLGHDDPRHAADTVPGGSGFAAVEHADGTVTLLGALGGGAWVHLQDGRLIGAYEEGDGPWVTLTGTETDVFERYATLLGEHLGSRGGQRVRLWASWYSYYEDVTEALMHAVLDGVEGLPFDVIQVDDGWQQAIGDWQPNGDFPSGMADMADRIRATGRRAGLWLAPFIAATDSQLATERPEAILRNSSGDPVVAGINWGAPYWALDVTAEATLDYLADLFSSYHQAGYDFFKLDFIYAAAFPGAHAKPASRADAYRSACERIREVVGEDTYLLACGAPIIESIGVFDGIRIGPDVGPVWDDGTYAAARRALLTALHRLWLSPAIDTDPDVAFFRQTELSSETQRHLQGLAQIANFLGTSDPPDWLTSAEREVLASALNTHPAVRQTSRYGWEVGGEELDFAPALATSATEPSWQVRA